MVGFVVHQNDNNKKIERHDVLEFCAAVFQKEISQKSAGNYLKRFGFSYKIAMSKTAGYSVTDDDLAILYMDWLARVRQAKWLDRRPSKVYSIDFTYTKQNQKIQRSWG